MSYKRKTKDVYKLWWKGECIDSFETEREATEMCVEYNLAFGGGVTVKRGREVI